MEESKPREPVEVPTCRDDGIGQLSAGRFLRPPASPTGWWNMVPRHWPAGESQHWARYTGTEDSMPSGTFHSRQERDIYLPCKFWSKKVIHSIHTRMEMR